MFFINSLAVKVIMAKVPVISPVSGFGFSGKLYNAGINSLFLFESLTIYGTFFFHPTIALCSYIPVTSIRHLCFLILYHVLFGFSISSLRALNMLLPYFFMASGLSNI